MPSSEDQMIGSRQRQVLGLIVMALIGMGFGVWILSAGFTTLGCVWVGVFLWRGQQFSVWLIAPRSAPSDTTPPLTSRWQRLLLSIVCVLGAAVCAVGVYLWRLWPEEWQAGLIFVLLGLLVLAPVTIKEIQSRRKALGTPTTE
jgi:peptidoglycan/LPS O-acetylase OafA/YrhL